MKFPVSLELSHLPSYKLCEIIIFHILDIRNDGWCRLHSRAHQKSNSGESQRERERGGTMKTMMMGIALIAVAVAALVSGANASVTAIPENPDLCFEEGWKSTSSFHLPPTHRKHIHTIPSSHVFARARTTLTSRNSGEHHHHHALSLCVF